MQRDPTFERKPWPAERAVAEVLWSLPGIRSLDRGTGSSGIPTGTTLAEVGISPNNMEPTLESLPPPRICKVNTLY